MTARASAIAVVVALACLSIAPALAIAQPAHPLLPSPGGSNTNALPAPISLPVQLQEQKPAPAEPAPNAHSTEATKQSTFFAIKVIAGLCALLALAYLGGHRKVVRFQERLGISGVITAGFPFVALGAIASHPSVGILNADVVSRLRPVLHFGLGWLGFIIGAQLDIRVLDRVPKGTAYLIFVEALGPFAITAAGCGALMIAFGMSIDDPATWRDMILLGTAAAMTAPRKFRGFANRTWHEGRGADVLLGQLDEMVGVIGLVFITAYFREDTNTTWQLPETAWVFVSLGLGVAIGVLIFAMIRVPQSNAEFLAIVLGGIAFASGLAGYLRLSPIAISFIAGVLVTNFPNDQRESVFRILHHLERPVHLLFLMIAGAVWNVTDWRGWVLVPLFVAGRVLGKWTGVMSAKTAVGAYLPANFADQRSWVTPLSGLSIALVISVQSLYQDTGLAWIVTAVIGGAIVTEFLVSRTSAPERMRTGPVATVPIDDLDHPAHLEDLDDLDSERDAPEGPIYRDEPVAPPPSAKPPTHGGGH
jgi:Kef-type K+ transport system membrane component KefB